MTRLQLILISTFVALFFVLYFGCDTKPSSQKAVESSRALALSETNIESLLFDAKKELSAEESANVLALEQQAASASGDEKIEFLIELMTSYWKPTQLLINGEPFSQLS